MDVPQHEEAARRILEEMKDWEGGVRTERCMTADVMNDRQTDRHV